MNTTGRRIVSLLLTFVLAMTGYNPVMAADTAVRLEVTAAEILAAVYGADDTGLYSAQSAPAVTVLDENNQVLDTYTAEAEGVSAAFMLENTIGNFLQTLPLAFEEEGSVLLRLELMEALEGKRLVKTVRSGGISAIVTVDAAGDTLSVYAVNTGGIPSTLELVVRDARGREMTTDQISTLIHGVVREQLTSEQLEAYLGTGTAVEILDISEVVADAGQVQAVQTPTGEHPEPENPVHQDAGQEIPESTAPTPEPEEEPTEEPDLSVEEPASPEPSDDREVEQEPEQPVGELPDETEDEEDDGDAIAASWYDDYETDSSYNDDIPVADTIGYGPINATGAAAVRVQPLSVSGSVLDMTTEAEERSSSVDSVSPAPRRDKAADGQAPGGKRVISPENATETDGDGEAALANSVATKTDAAKKLERGYVGIVGREQRADVETENHVVSLQVPVNAWAELTVGLQLADAMQEGYTVTFIPQNGEKEWALYVAAGEKALMPEIPSRPAGMLSFLGWFVEGSGQDAEPYDFGAEVTADLRLEARYSTHYIVKYKNAPDGKVIYTRQLRENEPAPAYTPPREALEVGDDLYFGYWYVEGGDEDIPFAFGYPLSDNVTLVPHFANGHYVYFQSGGTPVSPALVKNREAAEKPGDPQRKGFVFQHWSLEMDGEAYDFETPVTESITLYGVWKGEEVPYTIVYWVEAPNLPGGPQGHDDYVQAHVEKKTGTAGDTVSITSGDSPLLLEDFAAWRKNNRNNALSYAYFSHGGESEIHGDGSALINVYYNRTEYTIRFNMRALPADNGELIPGLQVNGEIYTGDDYCIRAKYEQDISGQWPLNGPLKVSGDGGATWEDSDIYAQGAWYPPEKLDGSPNNFDGESSFTWISNRDVMAADMILQNSDAVEYSVQAGYPLLTNKIYLSYRIQPWNTDFDWEAEGAYNIEGHLFLEDPQLSGYYYPIQSPSQVNVKCKDIDGLSPLFYDKRALKEEKDGLQIYALYYMRNTYTLTYDLRGAEEQNELFRDIYYGQPLWDIQLSDPDRDGYLFLGWFEHPDGREDEVDWEHAVMPARDLTLYARWESTEHTVNFHWDTSGGAAFITQGVAGGSVVKLGSDWQGGYPPISLPQVGDVDADRGIFQGWLWNNGGTYTVFPANTQVYRDYDLYGSWKTDGFTVAYELGEGEGTPPRDNYTYRMHALAQVLPPPEDLAHPDGRFFVGWQAGGQTHYPYNLVAVDSPVTALTAKYADEAVTLTYHANDGTDDSVFIRAESGTAVPLWDGDGAYKSFVNANRTYTLLGWSRNPGVYNMVDYAAGEALALSESTDLYAVWSGQEIVITANSDAKPYDGDPLTASGYTVAPAPPAGVEVQGIILTGAITDVGAAAAIADCSQGVLLNDGVDVSGRYKFRAVEGELRITERPALVQGNSEVRQYSGEAQVIEGYTAIGLLSGHEIVSGVTARGEGTEPGSYPVRVDVDHAKILDDAGGDVSKNYHLEAYDGTLTISEGDRLLWSISSGSGARTYSGQAQSIGEYTVTGLREGDSVSGISAAGTGTDVGSYPVTVSVEGYAVLDAGGRDVTRLYAAPVINEGVLQIGAMPVTVRAASASRVYTGMHISVATGGSLASGRLPDGESVSVSASGSGQAVGSYPITVDSVTVLRGTVDVTGNYNITSLDGVLQIYRRETGGGGGSGGRGGSSGRGTGSFGGLNTTAIDDEAVPLAQQPLFEIEDEEVPLAGPGLPGGTPMTGDTRGILLAALLCASAAMTGIAVAPKKRRKE